MFQHTIDQTSFRKALLDATAAAVLMASALLPILTIASVTLT
jgi:hypothetical protein